MQVCTSLQTDNHTNTPPVSFLQAGCPSCRPTNSVKALKVQNNQKYSIQSLQTVWKKCQRLLSTFANVCYFVMIINAFINVYHFLVRLTHLWLLLGKAYEACVYIIRFLSRELLQCIYRSTFTSVVYPTFRPHRMHRTDAACCYTCRTFRGLYVCPCVWHTVESCQSGWTDRGAVRGMQTRVDPRNHYIRHRCTLAPPGEYSWTTPFIPILSMSFIFVVGLCDWTICARLRCVLMSNYSDHLLDVATPMSRCMVT